MKSEKEDIFVRNRNGDKLYCPIFNEPCFKGYAWCDEKVKECAVLNLSKMFRSFKMDFERKEF